MFLDLIMAKVYWEFLNFYKKFLAKPNDRKQFEDMMESLLITPNAWIPYD
jgi:hypothetical protein